MSTKIAKKQQNQTAAPVGKNNELQILNKQHINNEGNNVIASPHVETPNLFSGSNMSTNCRFP